MDGAELERQVAGLAARARLIERALHDRSPWAAVFRAACGCESLPVPMRREIVPAEGRIVFTAYLGEELEDIESVEVLCGGTTATVLAAAGSPSGPCRARFILAISDFAGARD